MNYIVSKGDFVSKNTKYLAFYKSRLLTINLQELIVNWAQEFVKIFSPYSPSGLQLPKLHSWCYHVVPAIRKYGSINSMTTETYETLHKDYVKILY